MAIEEFPPPLWVCPYGCGNQINKSGKPPLRGDSCPQCGGLLEDFALEYHHQRLDSVRRQAFLEAAAMMCIKPTHEAADAFWKYWRENGETHKHGYYESTWGAINAALAVSGIESPEPPAEDGEVERTLRGNMATIAEEAEVVADAGANARTIDLIKKIADKALANTKPAPLPEPPKDSEA